MDEINIITAIANLPINAVLIFLVYKQHGQIDKLLAQICELERQHAEDIIKLLAPKVITNT